MRVAAVGTLERVNDFVKVSEEPCTGSPFGFSPQTHEAPLIAAVHEE
jgi:hypothetical protein